MIKLLFCEDLTKKYNLHPKCCESCHVDELDYGYDMVEFTTKDGDEAHVCCLMKEEYQDYIAETEQPSQEGGK